MQRIERDDGGVGDAEFSQQRLRCWDFVGLLGNVDMGEHEGGVGGERAQHLSGSTVMEVVEAAAQGLAIQRDAALSGCGVRRLQQGGMATEDSLYRGRIEPLEDVADGGVRGCAAPVQTEGGIEPAAMDVDEGDDAPIRVATGHDGKDGEQQQVGQLVELSLRPTWIGNVCEQAQQRRKCSHGNLRLGCCPRSQRSSASGIPLLISRFTSLRRCCGVDSV
jgi:hypothetical protein